MTINVPLLVAPTNAVKTYDSEEPDDPPMTIAEDALEEINGVLTNKIFVSMDSIPHAAEQDHAAMTIMTHRGRICYKTSLQSIPSTAPPGPPTRVLSPMAKVSLQSRLVSHTTPLP